MYNIYLAVVAGDYLFVMFGAVNNDNPAAAYFSLSSEVRVMDINQWSWVTSVSALTPEARSKTANNGGDSKDGGSQENNTGDTNHSAVSTGTIAGIVVGGVAGLAIIAGLLIFFFIRRRKNRKLKEKDNKHNSDRMPPNQKERECLFVYSFEHISITCLTINIFI